MTVYHMTAIINISTGIHINPIALRKAKIVYSRVICIDGWMTCDFMSFSTVFHSYKDNGWVIMKGCVQWNLNYRFKRSPQMGLKSVLLD